MCLLFLAEYHGKGLTGGICGILKEHAKNESLNRDCMLKRKQVSCVSMAAAVGALLLLHITKPTPTAADVC